MTERMVAKMMKAYSYPVARGAVPLVLRNPLLAQCLRGNEFTEVFLDEGFAEEREQDAQGD